MKKFRKRNLAWIVPVSVIALIVLAFFIYTGHYYHADAEALSALESDDSVTVIKTDFGWMFDGPSDSDALIFYQGAQVEETAYAPLLKQIASAGIDVLLVRMPFRLAFFGADKASELIPKYDYDAWYIGGHSLGGAMAAVYAAEHSGQLSGLILLAAYPTKSLDDSLTVISVYGSEDGVLNRDKLSEGNQYMPKDAVTYVINGGNHAQFGNYGKQARDGEALVSAEEQQRETVALIMQNK